MTTFAVLKNGQIPTEDEFINFSQDYLGIVIWSTMFSPIVEDEKVANIETTLFTEQQLDSFSMDWEFIEN